MWGWGQGNVKTRTLHTSRQTQKADEKSRTYLRIDKTQSLKTDGCLCAGDGCLVVCSAKCPRASTVTYVTLTSLSNACKKHGSDRAAQNPIQQKPKKEGRG